MAEVLLRLEVWRPARPDRHLVYAEQNGADSSAKELQEDRLHEQAFSWKLKGDIWTSLADTDEARKIKEAFTTRFSFSLPPEKRGFAKMRAVVTDIETYLANENNRPWQTWDQPIDDDDPDNVYQVQPLLSLYHHLKWICEVFQDIPGASVTVR